MFLTNIIRSTKAKCVKEERYKISGVEGLQGWEILEMIGMTARGSKCGVFFDKMCIDC